MAKKQEPEERRRNEIVALVAGLHAGGMQEGEVHGANIEPQEQHSVGLDILDALARCCTTLEEVCAAVCFDGHNLLISSNKPGASEYAPKFMTALTAFIHAPSGTTYDALERFGFEKASRVREAYYSISSREFEIDARDNQNSMNLISALQNPDVELSEILKYSRKVIEGGSAKKSITTLASEILRPVVDVRILARSLVDGRVRPEIINAVRLGTAAGEGGLGIKYIRGQLGQHAEMRVVQYLFYNNRPGQHQLGIGKLSCCPCYLGVGVANNRNRELNVRVTGTHGGSYKGWEPVSFMLEDDQMVTALREVGSHRYQKVREVRNLTRDEAQTEKPHLPSEQERSELVGRLQKEHQSLSPIDEATAHGYRTELVKETTEQRELAGQIGKLEADIRQLQIQEERLSQPTKEIQSKKAQLAQQQASLGKLKVPDKTAPKPAQRAYLAQQQVFNNSIAKLTSEITALKEKELKNLQKGPSNYKLPAMKVWLKELQKRMQAVNSKINELKKKLKDADGNKNKRDKDENILAFWGVSPARGGRPPAVGAEPAKKQAFLTIGGARFGWDKLTETILEAKGGGGRSGIIKTDMKFEIEFRFSESAQTVIIGSQGKEVELKIGEIDAANPPERLVGLGVISFGPPSSASSPPLTLRKGLRGDKGGRVR